MHTVVYARSKLLVIRRITHNIPVNPSSSTYSSVTEIVFVAGLAFSLAVGKSFLFLGEVRVAGDGAEMLNVNGRRISESLTRFSLGLLRFLGRLHILHSLLSRLAIALVLGVEQILVH